MDKNEILSDKEKYSEKFQHLLNNYSSGDINQYIFEKNPELLTIYPEKYSKLNLLAKRTYIWNKSQQILAHKSLLIKFIKRLVSDSWNKIIGNPDLKKFINKSNEKLNLSQRINIALNVYKVIRKYKSNFTIETIYDLFHINPKEIKIYKNKIDIGTYKNEIYKILDDKNCINIDDIIKEWRNLQKDFKFDYQDMHYKESTPIKTRNSQNKFIYKNILKENHKCYTITYTNQNIETLKIIGESITNVIIQFNKLYKNSFIKYKKYNFGKIYITNKKYNDFITFLLSLGSYVNEYKPFQIFGSKQLSNKISNKIVSIFNIVLFDINKNIHEIKSNIYISKNNLINKDFNFNKYILKNIFKNQKNTWKNNLCKIFCRFRIYNFYLYCPNIKKVMTKKLGIKK